MSADAVENADLVRLSIYDRYSKDILRDRFYRGWNAPSVTDNHPLVLGRLLAAGFAVGMLIGTGVAEALRFGGSLLIWGVFVRAVLVWHVTWLVNSATHLWGYRAYETDDKSRNNWLVAVLTGGEGWPTITTRIRAPRDMVIAGGSSMGYS